MKMHIKLSGGCEKDRERANSPLHTEILESYSFVGFPCCGQNRSRHARTYNPFQTCNIYNENIVKNCVKNEIVKNVALECCLGSFII